MSRLALMEPNMARLDALEIEVAELRHERDVLREACKDALCEISGRFYVAACVDDGCSPEWHRLSRLRMRIQKALAMSAPMLTDAEKAGLREAVAEPLPFTDGGHAVCPPADFE